ncbi:hypothetical protein GGU10DRAFT_337914, partial [Lentinula aff. detonsa]
MSKVDVEYLSIQNSWLLRSDKVQRFLKMTGIPKPQLSPLKGTPEGQRLRDVEISAALDEVTPKVVQQHIIWIESDDEDEQLTVQMERLSVKQEALNCTPQTGKKCTEDQWPSSSTHWYETPPPSRAPPDPPKYSLPKPSTSQTSSTSTVLSAARATPGRQGIFNAYVVYSGRTPYFYTDWLAVKCMLNEDKDLVFKGFFTLEQAEEAWYAASNSGVIVAIQNGTGRPIWSVTEGVKPAALIGCNGKRCGFLTGTAKNTQIREMT